MSGIELLRGNRLTLLRSGPEFFPALIEAIDQAQHELYIETYLFADDPSGRLVADALKRAAARGVLARVMVDAFGAKRFFGALQQELLDAGVEVLMYRPDITGWDLRRERLRRLHRKLAMIDGRVGFVGGINLIDDMHTPRHTPPRHDYAVRVEGPVLRTFADEMQRLWRIVAWSNFRQPWMTGGPRIIDHAPRGQQRAALLVRDNLRHRSDIEDAYLEAIAGAREEIVLACAYFFPGASFRRALIGAAERGVRVVLLLQGRVEYALLHYASRALYGLLLDAGIEIYEYTPSFLHAKVAVIDGRWATVGSSNIDPFSLLLAREANIVAADEVFARQLRESLLAHMEAGAQRVVRHQWRRNPLHLRVRIWIAYGVSRFLIGWFGYAGKH